MRDIESYPDKNHCELCGALKTDSGVEPTPDHSGAEVIRRLAFLADKSPSIALILIHHIAGRTEREIAARLKISHQAVHERISRAQKSILPICNQNISIK